MSDNDSPDPADTEEGTPRTSQQRSNLTEFVERCREDACAHGASNEPHPQQSGSPIGSLIDCSGEGDIIVDTKDLANEVLTDPNGRYSVKGYNERAHHLFGEIYLGLDKGPEYDRQATRVNSVIQMLSARDAFQAAVQTVREVLRADPGAADVKIIAAVLASACSRWFDLPDGTLVVPGGGRAGPPVPPAQCPGDYALPSACMFYSCGDELIGDVARATGAVLKQTHAQYVAQLRAAGKEPKGQLSRAIFEAFSPAEDDLIARTIIGVMMGMLPTTYFNLVSVLKSWRANGSSTFCRLQDELRQHAGSDPYARAYSVLAQPMMQAMQGSPMPPEVWRTATQDHMLGPIQVKTGDRVVVDIGVVTAADLARGKTDVFTIFGGDRNSLNPPTHACPGYEVAIALMLGTLNGLMEP